MEIGLTDRVWSIRELIEWAEFATDGFSSEWDPDPTPLPERPRLRIIDGGKQ